MISGISIKTWRNCRISAEVKEGVFVRISVAEPAGSLTTSILLDMLEISSLHEGLGEIINEYRARQNDALEKARLPLF